MTVEPQQIILSVLKYFLYLSNKTPETNETETPAITVHPPAILI